ncbi:MAG TPA: hypothetical protein VFR67_08800, partial [Pilimelia sp.]|nr:hypothetical protein [Pilimelia sp.]
DQPPPNAPGSCPDDGFSAAVTFTAYAGGMVADVEKQRADNEQREFSFDLSASGRIEMVIVQVCRVPPGPRPTAYCGTPQRYPFG